jgi:hypothetical protein
MAWRHNMLPILLFGGLIGLLMIVWVRLSALLFGVIVRDLTLDSSVAQLFFSGSGLTFLIVFTLVGAIIAAVVFVISVVSIPMMLDRKIDFITAVLTSLTAVSVNPATMVLWAALIVDLHRNRPDHFLHRSGHCLPLIGHASWHAYRDIVEDAATSNSNQSDSFSDQCESSGSPGVSWLAMLEAILRASDSLRETPQPLQINPLVRFHAVALRFPQRFAQTFHHQMLGGMGVAHPPADLLVHIANAVRAVAAQLFLHGDVHAHVQKGIGLAHFGREVAPKTRFGIG